MKIRLIRISIILAIFIMYLLISTMHTFCLLLSIQSILDQWDSMIISMLIGYMFMYYTYNDIKLRNK